MAISWSSKRKLIYGLICLGILILTIIILFFSFFYNKPSCFDGVMNGRELGTDCGGICSRMCQDAFFPPRIQWGGAKIEKLSEGLYNLSSYIVNPNPNGGALAVPYSMSLYDSGGLFITKRTGKIDLYPHRNTLAFESAVDVGKRIPVKASFEFTSPPFWFKANDNLLGLSAIDKKYSEDENGSNLQVVLKNKNLYGLSNVIVSVILLDTDGNVIGFSQTKIDSFGRANTASDQQIAYFTWPLNRKGQVASIEVVPSLTPVEIK